ncbi:hypothetical protein OG762_08800 [Streptomyces sp. NBC_01136]|uniref:hypothetical protein n=1 Tax=unclassified Streptomyces TaxID=2593676 RepID=UPI003246DA2C|nr:hypothetical protein OG762_08800 [Streptomyces sp. NBC_01136]
MNEGQRHAADEGDDSPHQGNRGAVRWGRERARAALGLAVWEIELAVTAGLLERGADRRFDPDEVTRTAADLDAFRARLTREHRFNASQAARRLGVSAARFARVVAQTGLAPVAEEQVRKYGRVLTVRYYRAVDVDGLAAYATADQVLREAVTAVGRPAAARKAAVTRTRNKERAEQARHELQAVRKQTTQGANVALVRYAAALAAGLPRGSRFLKKFVTDEAVGVLAAVVEECRMRAEERSALLDEVLPLAHRACAELTGPAEIERRSGVDPAVFAGRTDMIGGYMARAELEKVLAALPQWPAQARAAAVAAEAEAAVHRTRAAEEHAALAAAREAARLTNETVAELFGLPVDVVAALRPRGSAGLWNPQHVAALRAAPPPWLRSEEAARAEVALRESRAARAQQARADRRAGWRRTWAEQLGVPLDRVPENCRRPTAKAVRAARANPPGWARL